MHLAKNIRSWASVGLCAALLPDASVIIRSSSIFDKHFIKWLVVT